MRKKDLRRVYVGIDVSKDKLNVAWHGLDGSLGEFEVTNDATGHAEIIRRVTAGRIQEARVVLEATGSYGERLVAALTVAEKIRVMVARPAAIKGFAKSMSQRGKTDRRDAIVMAGFAKTDNFKATPLLDPALRQLRQLGRHMGQLIVRRAAVMNERHAAKAGADGSAVLFAAFDDEEKHLEALVQRLEDEIYHRIQAMPDARAAAERLEQIQGIKKRTVSRILPELLCMPKHLNAKQCVAYAGLDPRPNQSGSSKAGTRWPISKMGNARLRHAMYMATLTAVQWFPPLSAFYARLKAAGKPNMVALTASMRKLLTAVWAIVAKGQAFNEDKFTRRAAAA